MGASHAAETMCAENRGREHSARARDVSVGSENEEDGMSCGVRQSWDLRLSGHSKECEKPPSHPRV